jgi:hypothetical protein
MRITVQFNRMSIQGRVHVVDRAAVSLGNSVNALVNSSWSMAKTLPLMLTLANGNAALESPVDITQLTDELVALAP